jgi:hypothetical protein
MHAVWVPVLVCRPLAMMYHPGVVLRVILPGEFPTAGRGLFLVPVPLAGIQMDVGYVVLVLKPWIVGRVCCVGPEALNCWAKSWSILLWWNVLLYIPMSISAVHYLNWFARTVFMAQTISSYNCSCNCSIFILCRVFIVCIVVVIVVFSFCVGCSLCVYFCVLYFVWSLCYFVWCVLCLIVVPLPPGENPFAVKINIYLSIIDPLSSYLMNGCHSTLSMFSWHSCYITWYRELHLSCKTAETSNWQFVSKCTQNATILVDCTYPCKIGWLF